MTLQLGRFFLALSFNQSLSKLKKVMPSPFLIYIFEVKPPDPPFEMQSSCRFGREPLLIWANPLNDAYKRLGLTYDFHFVGGVDLSCSVGDVAGVLPAVLRRQVLQT